MAKGLLCFCDGRMMRKELQGATCDETVEEPDECQAQLFQALRLQMLPAKCVCAGN